MILYNGKAYSSDMQELLLGKLEKRINRTLAENTLDCGAVISAVDRLANRIASGEFDELIKSFADDKAEEYVKEAVSAMRRESMEFRIKTELGESFAEKRTVRPPYGVSGVEISSRPLGTLFHIAAGNVDGLPALSVLEGLLTGNVNILKLPQSDGGITVEILQRLIELEPTISDYVYVFDTPSSDISAMRKMAAMSDGIVVWGGEAAVKAVRTLAPSGAKLIEWGHRLGFAYISGYTDKSAELTALAQHVIRTRQLLCSSCQTIFLDTSDMAEIDVFCRDFLPYLEAAAAENPTNELGGAAEMSLRKYGDILEKAVDGERRKEAALYGNGCSVTACADSRLELSYMYGNVLVKRLPRKYLLAVLRRDKGLLQTAGLICEAEKRAELRELLIRAGVNRVMTAGNMSVGFCGEAHDGEYPLRRYLRTINVELN